MDNWIRIGAAILVIGAAFAALRWWQTRPRERPISPELMRKGAHVASGIVAMTFPWLFQDTWPVMVLCTISLLAMLAMRFAPIARDSIGRVTSGVERHSLGELYFPFGVAGAWWLSDGDPALFTISIGILTLADTAAALIGKAYGTRRFRTTEGYKSIEGSVAFFIIGFTVTSAGLLLLRDLPLSHTLLIATLLGLLLMMSEAIAWRGLDNLVVPVAAVALLKIYIGLSPNDLLVRLAVLASLTLVLVWWRNKTTLIGEGALAAVLYLYGAWALGGWPYLLPPLLLLLLLVILPRARSVPRVTMHGVGVVLALCAPGLLYLALATRGFDVLLSYAVAFAAATAVALLTQWHSDLAGWPRPLRVAGATLAGVLVGLSPIFSFTRRGDLLVWILTTASAALLATLLSFAPVLVRRTKPYLWTHRGVAIAIGSSLGLLACTIRA